MSASVSAPPSTGPGKRFAVFSLLRLVRAVRLSRRGARAVLLAAFAMLAAAGAMLWPPDLSRCLNPRPSGQLLDRDGKLLYAVLTERDQWCMPRPLAEINPVLAQATLATEDKRFYQHHGVDFISAGRAALQNIRRLRVVSGASTLSMQLVKQALPPTRFPLLRKCRQIVAALALEHRAGKEQILAAYLNSAPYGLNLVGCEAAARRYFGKPARELTLPEAATLAALPKSPARYYPVRQGGGVPRHALARRNLVLRRMWDEGYVTRDEYERARRAPLGARWHAFPAQAPHLAMRLKPDLMRGARIVTALDDSIQRAAQRLALKHVRIHGEGIQNAAVLVVDVPAGSVLARVGSASFFDTPGGQVDAARAPRSPGSALKPFTYALAMESQCLYPSEMLLDADYDYGRYKPGNYDKQFHGLVSAADALGRSLNVPALAVLDRLGTGRLHEFLTRLHFTTLTRPPSQYGLGLTLGNCDVRLDQLTSAYAMIANLGEYRPLAVFAEEMATSAGAARRAPERFLSRGICLKLFEMLEQPLPDEYGSGAGGQTVNVKPRVCWKTGTSTGHHDAWAFLFNAQYLVGVWMGNSKGEPSPSLVGARAALPLAQDVFRALPATNRPSWPDPLDDLLPAPVCALSGLPASAWCPHTEERTLPACQFLHRVCDMHYPAAQNQTGQETASVLERWPGAAKHWDLARITNAARVVETSAPVTNISSGATTVSPPAGEKAAPAAESPARATALPREEALSIRAPANDAQILLTHAPDGDRVRLSASLDDQTTLYWYLNGQYLGASEPLKPLLLSLTPGQHRLSCMTPGGVTANARFEVLDPE